MTLSWYAMADLESWHLALPKCQATTTRRRVASRWNFYRQIDKPRPMGGRLPTENMGTDFAIIIAFVDAAKTRCSHFEALRRAA